MMCTKNKKKTLNDCCPYCGRRFHKKIVFNWKNITFWHVFLFALYFIWIYMFIKIFLFAL